MGVAVPMPRTTADRVAERAAIGVVNVLVLAGGFIFWNPWHLVVERVQILTGVGIVASLVFGCAVCALPVPANLRSENSPGKRLLVAITVFVGAFQLWLMAVPEWPAGRHEELARSSDGKRAVVVHLSASHAKCLYIWAGRAPGTRVAGTIGKPGDNPKVTFEGRDLVVVMADPPESYSSLQRERFELRLDPATGRPLDKLRDRC
jgi:hypothetical protein